ncbi:hypothetical protein GGH92_002482 [Coemansia sp. RSA 2673]|nr:hypothetical protein GGH92_002482 [Coemansia sp. RSA 2673]
MIRNNADVNWDQRLLWMRFGAIPKFVPSSQGEREPEEPEIACIDVNPQDELWEHAGALYNLQVAIVTNLVEVQESPVPSMPVHPLATKFTELYKDRLHDELPNELYHLDAPRIHVWSCIRKLSLPIKLSTICQQKRQLACAKSWISCLCVTRSMSVMQHLLHLPLWSRRSRVAIACLLICSS